MPLPEPSAQNIKLRTGIGRKKTTLAI